MHECKVFGHFHHSHPLLYLSHSSLPISSHQSPSYFHIFLFVSLFHFYDLLSLTGIDFLSMGGSYSVKEGQLTDGVLMKKMSLPASTVIGANSSL